jgi:predicted DNA-binding transcriptional regulator YafY
LRDEKIGAPIEYKKGQGWFYTNRNFVIRSTKFIERLLIIDRKLRNEEYPHPKTLSAEFGVSVRTITKYIGFLNSIETEETLLEQPIKFDRRRNGYFLAVTNFRVPHIKKILS